MADNPLRLYGPANPSASGQVVYTTPAVTTTILRYLHVANNGAVGSDYSFSLYIGAASGTTTLWGAMIVPGASVYEWAGFIPLKPGEILTAYGSNANIVMTLAGVEVT